MEILYLTMIEIIILKVLLVDNSGCHQVSPTVWYLISNNAHTTIMNVLVGKSGTTKKVYPPPFYNLHTGELSEP